MDGLAPRKGDNGFEQKLISAKTVGVNFIKPKCQNLYFKMPKYLRHFQCSISSSCGGIEGKRDGNVQTQLPLFSRWIESRLRYKYGR